MDEKWNCLCSPVTTPPAPASPLGSHFFAPARDMQSGSTTWTHIAVPFTICFGMGLVGLKTRPLEHLAHNSAMHNMHMSPPQDPWFVSVTRSEVLYRVQTSARSL